MKKNLYISLLSMVALASCSKVDIDVPACQSANEVVAEKEISFQTAGYALSTKAGSSSFEGTFKTFGFFTGDSNWNSESTLENAVNYINGAEISNNSNVWKESGKTYYWPKAGKLSFVSYAPATANLQVNGNKNEMFSANAFEPSYDLMIGETAADKTGPEAVSVLFRHVLSQVNFTAQVSELESNGLYFEVSINSISLENIANKGDFSWNALENKASFGKQNSYYGNKQVSETVNFEDGDIKDLGTSLYIPQMLNNSNLEISYSINTYVIENGTKVYVDKVNNTKSVSLESLNGGEWKSGYSYVYNITINTLSEDNITVTPYIENDWKTIEHEINM